MISHAQSSWTHGAAARRPRLTMNTPRFLARWQEQSPEQWLAGVNRYAPPGVTTLLVLVVAYQLSRLTWLVLPGGGVPIEQLPAVGPPLQTATQPSPNYVKLKGSQLFGTAPKTSTPVPQAVVDAPDTTLDLALTGILYGQGNVPSQAIISSNRGPEKTYHIGQAIENANGTTLHSVYADRVILNRGDRLETLRFPKQPATAGAGRAASRLTGFTPPAPRPTQSQSLRQVISQNASRLTDILRIAPQVEQGQVVGFRVNPGRDRAAFEALGLHPGDVVTDINGTTLNDPSRGLQVFEQLGETTQANVTVLRDGSPQVLVVNTGQLQQAEAEAAPQQGQEAQQGSAQGGEIRK